MELVLVLNSYQTKKQDPNYRLPFSVKINGKNVQLQEYTDQLIGVRADKDGKLKIQMTLDGKADQVKFKYPRFVSINPTAFLLLYILIYHILQIDYLLQSWLFLNYNLKHLFLFELKNLKLNFDYILDFHL